MKKAKQMLHDIKKLTSTAKYQLIISYNVENYDGKTKGTDILLNKEVIPQDARSFFLYAINFLPISIDCKYNNIEITDAKQFENFV